MLISSQYDDYRQVLAVLQTPHHLEPAHGRHLQIEQNQIGMPRPIFTSAVAPSSASPILRCRSDSTAQNLAGNWLIVDDQRVFRSTPPRPARQQKPS